MIQEENKFGGRLLDKPKQIPFQDGGHNLCLTIEDLSPGWRSKLAANYQVRTNVPQVIITVLSPGKTVVL